MLVAPTMDEILRRLRAAVAGGALAGCQGVVAVARGGLVPAGMLAQQLGLPLDAVRLEWYEDGMDPARKHAAPLVLERPARDWTGKRVLLVDDLVKSGGTLAAARELLPGAEVLTFAVVGPADVSLFAAGGCYSFPWNPVVLQAAPAAPAVDRGARYYHD